MINEAQLEAWCEENSFEAIDTVLLRFFCKYTHQPLPPAVQHILLQLSQAMNQGHVCLPLDEALLQLPQALAEQLSLQQCRQSLIDSGLLAETGPLVLQQQRLYLRRYWQYEADIKTRIQQLIAQELTLDLPLVKATLERFFAPQEALDWQKIACAIALKSHFTVITGGPGTGKTTTVTKLLLVLQSLQAQAQEKSLVIRLAAPTGKAAARLKESLNQTLTHLEKDLRLSPALVEKIPTHVSTLHRLLGKHSEVRAALYHQGRPLPVDVLVVDEASMVDIELMSQLLDALPAHARLILLGDKDQLASVEAGAILAELCRNMRLGEGQFNQASNDYLAQILAQPLTAPWLNNAADTLDQHVVMLQKSYRFDGKSGIGQLALAVNNSDNAGFDTVLNQGFSDLLHLNVQRMDAQFEQFILHGHKGAHGFMHYLHRIAEKPALHASDEDWEEWAKKVLDDFSAFQILCATREGAWGVKAVNTHIVRLLHTQNLIRKEQEWFEGRPILITQNDYTLGLMNGDIGIMLRKPVQLANGDYVLQARVAFLNSEGQIKWVLASRLNHLETCFAMTIHKSQGSEFAHVLMVLPEQDMPILTKELVYTGITRAKENLSLLATKREIIQRAISRQVVRNGGLKGL